MYTYNSLIKQMKNMGIVSTDTLLVHSSMRAVGKVDRGADTVLDALMYTVRDGLLVLPTHTWATMNDEHNLYDYKSEPSCVGILGNIMLKREGTIRSLHPTHSVVAYGKDSESYVSGEEHSSTPCSRAGCMGKLYDRHGKILMLGCGLNKFTYMHGVEEWNKVSNRLTDKSLELKIKLRDDTIIPCHMKKHFKPNDISISEYYVKLYTPFIQEGIMKTGNIGDAECMLIDAVGAADYVTDILKKDEFFFYK